METITSPDGINTIRGVEVTWQLVTAALPDKSNARAHGYLQDLLQTKGELGAGAAVSCEKIKWKPLNALLPPRSWTVYFLGSCFWLWLLGLPPHWGGRYCCVGWLSPPWGPQSQPGKPQPYQEGSAVNVTLPPAWEEGSDACTVQQAWGKLLRAPGLRTPTFDFCIEALVHLLQASWRKWRYPKTC